MARLLDLRRISAMKEQAITAQDYETAARHREEEKRAREAFVKALEAWRAELNPPEAGS
jgi:UvrB/UvrC motif-containing protein